MPERWKTAKTGEHIQALVVGVCDEPTCCGPIPGGRNGAFCSNECYRVWHRRAVTRGFRIYRSFMRWIETPRPCHQKGAKNPPNPYLGDLTAFGRDFMYEDRELREKANAERERQAG
jgi:hypothetical protein